MQALLLSIAPFHADRIFCGEKPWEFRRVRPRALPGTTVFVYETRPRMEVTGSFVLGRIHSNTVGRVAELETDTEARLAVHQYLVGASRPCALEILEARRFDRSLPLSAFDLRRPPQSYAWVMLCKEAI
jgi:predicted transcriptional regulator